MKTLLCFIALTALALVGAVADVNVTGKWSGSFNTTAPDGTAHDSTAVLVLKQNGSEVTGTAGPNEDEQHEISKGKIEGEKLTLEVPMEDGMIQFDLVVAEDRIKGDANMSHGDEKRQAKVDVTRAK